MKNLFQRYPAIVIVSTGILALVIAVIVIMSYSLFAPHYTTDTTSYVYIDHDDTVDSVLIKVKEAGQSSGTTTLAMLMKLRKYKVRTGRYPIEPGDGNYTVFHRLASGLQVPIMLTIGTPRTVQLLARSIGSQLEIDSAAIASRLMDSLFCAQLGYTVYTIPALFIPNSYEMYWDASMEDFFERIRKEYARFWDGPRTEKAELIGLTPVQVSTLASIVDSETNYTPEKATVAGLYINRLHLRMKLQSDPTVIFGLRDFSIRRVGGSHLSHDSPYNTYRYEGLPPGPIRIPSISGIDAVLNYETHPYIYMCAKEDFSGSHNFSVTWTEHKANARRYQKALTARNILLKP